MLFFFIPPVLPLACLVCALVLFVFVWFQCSPIFLYYLFCVVHLLSVFFPGWLPQPAQAMA